MIALIVSSIVVPISAALTSAQETEILNRHNSLRSSVSSPCTAADMEKMVWDTTLASAAQTYANGCVGDHDPQLTSMGGSVSQGENLFMQFPGTDYTTAQLVQGAQDWYDEIQDTEWTTSSLGLKSKVYADYSACKAPESGKCSIGHFTQVVWAKSNKIGCGVAACSGGFTASGSSEASGVLLVCRYTPMGNIADQTNGINIPYMYGAKCAACSGSCTDGLCTSAPNRCKDDVPFTVNSDTFQTCAAVIQQYSTWCSQMEDGFGKPCQKECGVCSPAAGMGAGSCGGGGNSSVTSSGASSGTSTVGSTGAGHATTVSAMIALALAALVR